MNRTRQDLVLGLVFFAALAGLLWATMSLSGLTFGETHDRSVVFQNVDGLERGDAVYVRGLQLGRVREIRLMDDGGGGRQILVDLRFDEPVSIGEGYVVRIEEDSFLGGRRIQIDPGTGPELPESAVLTGSVREGALSALSELLEREEIQAILDEVLEFFRGLNETDSSLGLLLNTRELYDDVHAFVRSLRTTAETLERGDGLAHRVFYDPELADRVERAVEGFDAATASVTALADDLRETVAGVRRGEGPIGVLVADEAAAANLRGILSRGEEFVASAADFAEKANDPAAGLLGELVAGSGLRETVLGIADDLAAVVHEVRTGRGLLARLVFDEALGEQLSRTITLVARGIEDAREAAPIATFFQVVTAAF